MTPLPRSRARDRPRPGPIRKWTATAVAAIAAANTIRLGPQAIAVTEKASSGISTICPAVLPEVAMLVASASCLSKYAAIVAVIKDGAIAAKPIPPRIE